MALGTMRYAVGIRATRWTRACPQAYRRHSSWARQAFTALCIGLWKGPRLPQTKGACPPEMSHPSILSQDGAFWQQRHLIAASTPSCHASPVWRRPGLFIVWVHAQFSCHFRL